jgi:squalene-associated FAD-dependent desaturase
VTPSKAHVVGAGLAGLAAATALAERGVEIEVSEAAAQAGGRCRSYFDAQVGLVIDNGNHLALSGNMAVAAYLARLGAGDRLRGPKEAEFPFIDLANGSAWTLRANPGPIPWWILDKGRGVPGAGLSEYLGLARLFGAAPDARVDEALACEGPLWERLIGPFLRAALNTAPETGSAALAAAVVSETLARGGRAYRPRIASPTLAAAFVEPAVAFLAGHGASVRLGRRLRALVVEEGRVVGLKFSDGATPVAGDEAVILAVPPWVAAELVEGLQAPDAFESIVNGHFAARAPAQAPLMTGVIGGTVEWIFCFEDRISVTVSAANRIVDEDRESLARRLWADVAAAFGLAQALPAWQIVKEKRATFAATPEQERKRPGARTSLSNLLLAGDWTATRLPATIEGAIRSGFRAADLTRGLARE